MGCSDRTGIPWMLRLRLSMTPSIGDSAMALSPADAEKPPLLKAYLDRFKTTVQRYFPVPAGSDVQAFANIVANYPVFELVKP